MLLSKQLYQTFKKLVLVLAISAPITEANKENIIVLNLVSCICFLIWLKKN